MEKFIENNLNKLNHCNKDVVNSVLKKARVAKSWINQLFGIDENIGYKRVSISIDKVDMLKNYIKNNYQYMLKEVKSKLSTSIDNFIINDIEVIEKNKIKINIDIAQNRNKHIYTNKNIEIKITDMYSISFFLLQKEYLVDEIENDLHHKVICECKSDIEIYVVTNSIAMLFASESNRFNSCHKINIKNKYTNGNLQNLLSGNVFAIYRIKNNELISRAWIYTNKFEEDKYTFIVSRIYNNSQMTGRHIVNMFNEVSKEKNLNLEVKYFKSFDFYMANYYGFNDVDSGRKAIYISNTDTKFKEIKFENPVDLITGEEYDDYSGMYTRNKIKVSCCSYCNEPIYVGDYYIVTTNNNYYHENCGGYWRCEDCDSYHDDNIPCYKVFITKYYSHLKCNTENAFYCQCCNNYYKNDNTDKYKIYTSEKEYYEICEHCIKSIDIFYCEYCDKNYEKNKIKHHTTIYDIYICQFCYNEKVFIKCDECKKIIINKIDIIKTDNKNICKECKKIMI